MEITLLLEYSERGQLREWLQNNHNTAKECWVAIYNCSIPISLKRRFALDGSTALSSGCQMDDWLNDSHQDAKIVIGPI